MKTKEASNPQFEKTFNPNFEPWLTLAELYAEAEALRKSYSKWN